VAAKEIKDLIEISSAKVDRGAQQAGEVSMNMNKVSTAIGRVSDIVSEITAASEEQSKGIQQVHQAITQIDEVTQQNAALVEESAAAAQSLQEQANKMKVEVGFFHLGGDASSPARLATLPQPKQLQAHRPRMPAKSLQSPPVAKASLPAPRPAATANEEWETF
jgi:methyl-accepting chemotaxis protein